MSAAITHFERPKLCYLNLIKTDKIGERECVREKERAFIRMSTDSEPNGDGILAATGTVSYAMDGLMYGYERLERSLPGIAAKVSSLQTETEDMAQRLEVIDRNNPFTHNISI